MNTDRLPSGRTSCARPSPPEKEERERGRSAQVSACPFGAVVCTEWARREAGLCLECWAGVLERANAVSEWLR